MDINDLRFLINPRELTADAKSKLNLYITYIKTGEKDTLVFKNEKKIPAEDLPGLDDTRADQLDCGDIFYFCLYFDYGEDGTDICTKASSDQVSVVSPMGWDVSVRHDKKAETYWILSPKETFSLKPGNNIEYKFSNILCNQEPGPFAMHIMPFMGGEWLPAIHFYDQLKLSKPVITMFKAVNDDYLPGDRVELVWSFENADMSCVELDKKLIPNEGKSIVDIENRDYILRVRNRVGCEVERKFSPKCLYIESFDYDVHSKPGYLILHWNAPNATSCKLSGVGTFSGASGSYTHKITSRETHFELTAQRGNAKCTKTIDYTFVKEILCKRFDVKYIGNNMVHVEWELENAEDCRFPLVGNVEPKGSRDIKIAKCEPIKLLAYVQDSFIEWCESKIYTVPGIICKKFEISRCEEPGYISISWELENAEKCTLKHVTKNSTGNPVSVSPSGSLKVKFQANPKKPTEPLDTNFVLQAKECLTGSTLEKTICFGMPKILSFKIRGIPREFALNFIYKVDNTNKITLDFGDEIREIIIPLDQRGPESARKEFEVKKIKTFGACILTAENELGHQVKQRPSFK